MKNQSSNHLFMIEPEVFYSNEQTADSNHRPYSREILQEFPNNMGFEGQADKRLFNKLQSY